MSKLSETIAQAIEYCSYCNDRSHIYEQALNILSRLDKVEVKVWRESEDVKLPTYAKPGDACMDVYVHSVEAKDDGRIVYHTGLHFKLPEDYEMEIRPRSSNTKTTAVMQNSPGTLDEGYTGELMIVHRCMGKPYAAVAEYSVGDRVAQILIRHRECVSWNEVNTQEELGNTERGVGGFGSSGK